jgi:hypothetical protein
LNALDTQTIHTDLYITHDDETLLTELVEALEGTALDEEGAGSLANRWNPKGAALVAQLFSHQYVNSFDFENGADEEADYRVLHLHQGEWGDSNMVHLIDFLHALIPGIQAQAWGYTEDDPWEFFIKYEDGRAIKQEHVPWEDVQMDDNALEYIYKWWHEDLPDEIEVGLLSVEDEDEDEDWDEENER